MNKCLIIMGRIFLQTNGRADRSYTPNRRKIKIIHHQDWKNRLNTIKRKLERSHTYVWYNRKNFSADLEIRFMIFTPQQIFAWSNQESEERCTWHVWETGDICTVFWLERPPLWSSGQSFWLQIQRSRVRFPALPDFLSSSGSGTGTTQPREVNWGATWIKTSGSGPENRD